MGLNFSSTINEEDEFKKVCQTRAFGTVVLENIAK